MSKLNLMFLRNQFFSLKMKNKETMTELISWVDDLAEKISVLSNTEVSNGEKLLILTHTLDKSYRYLISAMQEAKKISNYGHIVNSLMWHSMPSMLLPWYSANLQMHEDEVYVHGETPAEFKENPCRHSPSIPFSIPTFLLLEPPQYDPAASATLRQHHACDHDWAESLKYCYFQ